MTEQKQVVGRNPWGEIPSSSPNAYFLRMPSAATNRAPADAFWTGYAASPKLLRYCFDCIPAAQTQNDIISTTGKHSVQPRRSTC